MQNLTRERLDELDKDPAFKEQLRGLAAAREEYCSRTGWFGETHADTNLKRVMNGYLDPDTVLKTTLHVLEVEQRLGRQRREEESDE